MPTVTLEQCKQAFSDGARGRNRPTDPTLLDYWLSASEAGIATFVDEGRMEASYPVTADRDDDEDDYDYDDRDDDDDGYYG